MLHQVVNRASRHVLRPLGRVVPAWRHRPGGFLPRQLLAKIDQSAILFIHIPKCGGTSIAHRLYGREIHHRPAREILAFHPLRFRAWKKIAIIRDPVSRFLSAYDYLMGGGRNAHDAAFAAQYVQPWTDPNLFVSQFCDPRFRRSAMGYFHFRRQSDYVTGFGYLIVNHLLRFEAMEEDLHRVTGLSQIPHANATPGKRTPRAALSAESIALIERLYRDDFLLWDLARARRDDVYGAKIQRLRAARS